MGEHEKPRLSSEDVNRILGDVTLGKPPSIQTPEALALYARLAKEVEEIAAGGGFVGVPGETV